MFCRPSLHLQHINISRVFFCKQEKQFSQLGTPLLASNRLRATCDSFNIEIFVLHLLFLTFYLLKHFCSVTTSFSVPWMPHACDSRSFGLRLKYSTFPRHVLLLGAECPHSDIFRSTCGMVGKLQPRCIDSLGAQCQWCSGSLRVVYSAHKALYQ